MWKHLLRHEKTVFLCIAAALLLSGCPEPGGPGVEEEGDESADGSDDDGGSSDGVSDDGYADAPDAGSLMVFVTNKLSSDSGYSPVGGGVSWEHDDYGVIRWIEGSDELAVISTDRNSSYGHSEHIAVISIGNSLWHFRSRHESGSSCATSTCGKKTMRRIDPVSNETVAQCEAFDTSGWNLENGHVAIVGDAIYFKEAIEEDFQGNYEGGGFLARDRCDGTAPERIAIPGIARTLSLIGAGSRLVGWRFATDTETESLVLLDLETGEAIRELPFPVADVDSLTIPRGSDELYAASEQGSTVSVFAFDWDNDAWDRLFELETGGESFNLDGNGDDVLLTVSGQGAYLYDRTTAELRTLDLPSAFLFSNPDGAGEHMRAP